MPIGEVVALASLSLALVASVTGGLVYAYKIGGLVATLSSAIAEMRAWHDNVAKVPLLEQRLGTLEGIQDETSRRLSDFPRMREKQDSLVEDLVEIKDQKLDARVAVLERLTGSQREIRAPRPPTLRREEEEEK